MNLESIKVQTLSGDTFEFNGFTSVSYKLEPNLEITRGVLDHLRPIITEIEIEGPDYQFKCGEISYVEIRTDVRIEKFCNEKVEVGYK